MYVYHSWVASCQYIETVIQTPDIYLVPLLNILPSIVFDRNVSIT